MVQQTINIGSTFDVARARNYMRKIADENSWNTVFRVRTAAIITTLAEMALFKGQARMQNLVLHFDVLEYNGHGGIEFCCDIPATGRNENYFSISHSQLERTSDELTINQQDGVDHIVVRLWAD